jgi:hypothetical protein
VTFSATASIPEFWTCRCGQPAGLDKGNPPEPEQFASLRFPAEQKSHLAYVRQRRSQADGEVLIEWALDRLHAQRERRRRDQVVRVTRPNHVMRWQPRRRSRAQRQRSCRNSHPGSPGRTNFQKLTIAEDEGRATADPDGRTLRGEFCAPRP